MPRGAALRPSHSMGLAACGHVGNQQSLADVRGRAASWLRRPYGYHICTAATIQL